MATSHCRCEYKEATPGMQRAEMHLAGGRKFLEQSLSHTTAKAARLQGACVPHYYTA